MSDAPASPPPARSSAGIVPLLLWVVILVLGGLALGIWGPWKTTRHAPNSPRLLVQRLADPMTRETAKRQLLDVQGAVGPELLAAAQDPSYPARADAIQVLGRLRYAPAEGFLVQLREPALEDVRLSALGNLGGAAALRELRAALKGPRVELHFVALRKLSHWDEQILDDELHAEVLPFLTHASFGLREFAAIFLGKQRDAAATGALIRCLEDDHGDVRRAAAEALIRVGAPEGIQAVQAAYAAGAIPEEP